MKQFRTKFFSFLIFVIIFFSIAILIFMWVNLNHSIEIIAKNKIEETTQKISTRLDSYFNEIRKDLLIIKEETDNGLIDAEYDKHMNYYLMPLFNNATQITTFAVARTDGYEFSLLREDTTWLNNLVYETDSGMNIFRERWAGHYTNPRIVFTTTDYNAGYDPRTRAWFKGAASAKDTVNPFWSQPYKIMFQTFPGITASIKARSKVKNVFNIVQFDILLSNISKFTRELAFGENGKVFILSEDYKLLGLPYLEDYQSDDSLIHYVLKPYDSLPYQPMQKSVLEWNKAQQNAVTPVYYRSIGKKWWGKLSKYHLDNGRYFIIGVIVPESDFLSDIKRTRNFIVICGFIIIFFILFVAKGYFDKRKANKILEQKNEEIEAQKEEIEAQRDEIQHNVEQLQIQNEKLNQAMEEIETQNDLLLQQKEKIQEFNQEMTDSIRYAKRIQGTILPTDDMMDKLLRNYFVIFKPKDIVSGDFYWMTEVEGKIIFAVADCTGHGVPGAFMSMLGAAFLNEVANKEYITHPGVILRRIRKAVIKALQQKGTPGEQKDGMDIALCTYEPETKMLQFAGANNPLYIIREKNLPAPEIPDESMKKLESEKHCLYEIKADKMPIAIYERMDRFTTHSVKLLSGDTIYIFSDGYADQFGGPKGKKFKYKQMKNKFLELQNLPIQEQGKILDHIIEEWKGTIEQIDDILVIGVRIKY